jgi:deoxyribonuclease-4
MAHTMRVREVLSALSSLERQALKKLLPSGVATSPADLETQRYPSALLSCFPAAYAYSLLGLVAEALLSRHPDDITIDTLVAAITTLYPTVDPTALTKLRASKTTPPFLAALQTTRTKLEAALDGAIPRTGQVVRHGPVEGHPDMRTSSKMIEIKLTGQLAKNWLAFVFQAFAYGALAPEATEVCLVLPLQQAVWRFELRGWTTRTAYRDALCTAAEKAMAFAAGGGSLTTLLLLEEHLIGHHVPKLKSLPDTVRSLPDTRRPYQIFLGAPHTSKMAIADAELAAAAALVEERRARIYIHSQYLINLSNPATDDPWHVELLKRNLQAGAAMGARGVVVHVGKALKAAPAAAVAVMRDAIASLLPHATSACPLLLETPAGQGTEVLTEAAAFMEFVASFADTRVRACIDTCHVFACGHNPLEYIRGCTERDPTLLKLVHYNDSAAPCGSCVDRHAYVGRGEIGLAPMQAIAEFCSSRSVPMVIE